MAKTLHFGDRPVGVEVNVNLAGRRFSGAKNVTVPVEWWRDPASAHGIMHRNPHVWRTYILPVIR